MSKRLCWVSCTSKELLPLSLLQDNQILFLKISCKEVTYFISLPCLHAAEDNSSECQKKHISISQKEKSSSHLKGRPKQTGSAHLYLPRPSNGEAPAVGQATCRKSQLWVGAPVVPFLAEIKLRNRKKMKSWYLWGEWFHSHMTSSSPVMLWLPWWYSWSRIQSQIKHDPRMDRGH